MSHQIIISIPTKTEIKTKTSEFWNKYKKPIFVGTAVSAAAATAYVAKSLIDADNEQQLALEAATVATDEDGNEYLLVEEVKENDPAPAEEADDTLTIIEDQ